MSALSFRCALPRLLTTSLRRFFKAEARGDSAGLAVALARFAAGMAWPEVTIASLTSVASSLLSSVLEQTPLSSRLPTLFLVLVSVYQN